MQAPLLSREQEIDLAQRWQRDRDVKARNDLVMAHMKLVYKMQRRYKNHQIPPDDFTDAGGEGLILAADRFDTNMGFRFATYARWWIRTKIDELLRADIANCTIGKERHVKKVMTRLTRAHMQFGGVSDEIRQSIADDLAIEISEVFRIEGAVQSRGFSLNQKVGAEEGSPEYLDAIEDETICDDDFIRTRLHLEQKSALEHCLSVLTPRERMIVQRRKLSDPPMTLKDLSKQLGSSSERVRQIEVKALDKLKRTLKKKGFNAQNLLGDG